MSTESDLSEVSLFPLGMPLLPTVTLSLRIFEQRYLRLVSESLRDSRPFGVVPIRSGREVGEAPTIFTWGSLVRITDWTQRDNGLLGIDIRADRVLQVQETWVEPDGLMQARVRLFSPDNPQPIPERFSVFMQLLDDLTQRPATSALRMHDDERDLATLGWRLAQLLPVQKGFLQKLLQERDPLRRMDMVERAVATIAHK